MSKYRKNIITILVILAVFVTGCVITKATQTVGGTVAAKEIEFVTSDTGAFAHGQIFVPKSATAEAPAPIVITLHGGGDNSSQVLPVSIEFARRGYVVFSLDGTGNGESENTNQVTAINNAIDYLLGLDYTTDDVIMVGHSAGGMNSWSVATERPDIVKLVISNGMDARGDTLPTNWAYVVGKYDASNLSHCDGNLDNMVSSERYLTLFGTDRIVEEGKLYGSWEDGTGRIYIKTNTGHTWEMFNKLQIRWNMDLANQVVPSPNLLDYNDQIWGWAILGQGMVFLSVLALAFAMAALLLKTPFFSALLLPTRKPIGFRYKSPAYFGALVVLVCMAPLLYGALSGVMEKHGFAWMQMNSTADGLVHWHWAVASIYVVLFLLFHFLYARKQGGCLMTYGLATEAEENKIRPAYILRAITMSVTVFLTAYLVYMLYYRYVGHAISFTKWKMGPISNYKTGQYLLYFLLELPYLVAVGLASRSISINNGERRQGEGMRRSVALSLSISSIGLIVYQAVFLIVLMTTGHVLYTSTRGYMFFTGLFGNIPWLAVCGLLNCYITNKTNSVYTGVLTATMFQVWALVGNFPMNMI